MNNRLAMCLVGPVQLSLGYTQAAPGLWEKVVKQLRPLPEFVATENHTILLRSQLVHRFTPATVCSPFPGAPDFLAAQWAIMLTLCDRECLCMLGTQFHDGTQVYEFPIDMPLAHLDPFVPLVDDLETFLGHLNVALTSLGASRQDSAGAPVLCLEYLGVAVN